MKISVAMATYNGASYLSQQLESIFAQTRLPDEIIVCDDGSTDETPELLRGYAKLAPCDMHVIINEERLGSTKNFEQAICRCSGEIIALSDQDDIWGPQKLATIEGRFEASPDIGLVFSNGDLIDQNGERLPGDIWSRFRFGRRLQRLLDSSRYVHELMLSRYFITGATMAFRSNFRNVCLPIPVGITTFIHDRWIAVMVGAVARVERLDERLIAYRLHSQQQMGVGNRTLLQLILTPSCCSNDYEALDMMRSQLANSASDKPAENFLRALDTRQRHLAARAALSPRLARRLKGVVSEYLSGGYRRYPLGSADALKDLLVGTR